MGAPLSVLALLGYGRGNVTATLILVLPALLAGAVLLATALQTRRDHDPAPVPAATTGVGRRSRWSWVDVVAAVPATLAMIVITGSIILGITAGLDGSLPPSARTAVESFASQAAVYAAVLLALTVLLLLRRGLRIPDLGWVLPRRLGALGWPPWLAIAVVVAFVAVLLAGITGNLSAQLLPGSPNTQCTAVRSEYGGYLALAIPLVCLIAPIAEETVFRGFLYGWLRRRLTVAPAVVVSAAIFASAHAVLVLALPLFVVGIILALLYEYSDSLIPPAIAHGLFNLPGILAILGSTSTC